MTNELRNQLSLKTLRRHYRRVQEYLERLLTETEIFPKARSLAYAYGVKRGRINESVKAENLRIEDVSSGLTDLASELYGSMIHKQLFG